MATDGGSPGLWTRLVRRVIGPPGPADTGAVEPSPDAGVAPQPVARAPRRDWAGLPPLRTQRQQPAWQASEASTFAGALSRRHAGVRYLAQLGHQVTDAAPSGIVTGLARSVQAAPTTAPTVALPLAPRRRRSRAAPTGRGPSWPESTGSDPDARPASDAAPLARAVDSPAATATQSPASTTPPGPVPAPPVSVPDPDPPGRARLSTPTDSDQAADHGPTTGGIGAPDLTGSSDRVRSRTGPTAPPSELATHGPGPNPTRPLAGSTPRVLRSVAARAPTVTPRQRPPSARLPLRVLRSSARAGAGPPHVATSTPPPARPDAATEGRDAPAESDTTTPTAAPRPATSSDRPTSTDSPTPVTAIARDATDGPDDGTTDAGPDRAPTDDHVVKVAGLSGGLVPGPAGETVELTGDPPRDAQGTDRRLPPATGRALPDASTGGTIPPGSGVGLGRALPDLPVTARPVFRSGGGMRADIEPARRQAIRRGLQRLAPDGPGTASPDRADPSRQASGHLAESVPGRRPPTRRNPTPDRTRPTVVARRLDRGAAGAPSPVPASPEGDADRTRPPVGQRPPLATPPGTGATTDDGPEPSPPPDVAVLRWLDPLHETREGGPGDPWPADVPDRSDSVPPPPPGGPVSPAHRPVHRARAAASRDPRPTTTPPGRPAPATPRTNGAVRVTDLAGIPPRRQAPTVARALDQRPPRRDPPASGRPSGPGDLPSSFDGHPLVRQLQASRASGPTPDQPDPTVSRAADPSSTDPPTAASEADDPAGVQRAASNPAADIVQPDAPSSPEDLFDTLYPRIRDELRWELRVQRERAGFLADPL